MIDAAIVTNDEQGKVQGKVKIHETEELTAKKGALRGALVTGVLGLIYPPSLIASRVTGGVIGALAGVLRDSGVKKEKLDEIGRQLVPGKSAVAALAEGEWVYKIQAALEGYEGELVTHVLDEVTVKRLYEHAELERQPVDRSE